MSDFVDDLDYSLLDKLEEDFRARGLVPQVQKDGSFNATRGFKSSFAGLDSTLRGVEGMVSGREDLMMKAELSKMDNAKYSGDTQDFTDIYSVGSALDWFSFNAGNAVGSIATTVAGGGIGGALAKGAAKHMANKELAKRAGMATGMLSTTYPQQLGETANKIYSETHEMDFGIAPITAALGAGLDILPVIRELDKFGMAGKARQAITNTVLNSPSKIKQISKSLGGTMLAEGSTEAAQDALGLVALEWVNENKDHFSIKDLKGLLNSFAAGAAGGATLGAPAAVAQAIQSEGQWVGNKPAIDEAQQNIPEEYKTVEEPIEVSALGLPSPSAIKPHPDDVYQIDREGQASMSDKDNYNATAKSRFYYDNDENPIYAGERKEKEAPAVVPNTPEASPELDTLKVDEYISYPERFENFGNESLGPIQERAMQTLQKQVVENSQKGDFEAVKRSVDRLSEIKRLIETPVAEVSENNATQQDFIDNSPAIQENTQKNHIQPESIPNETLSDLDTITTQEDGYLGDISNSFNENDLDNNFDRDEYLKFQQEKRKEARQENRRDLSIVDEKTGQLIAKPRPDNKETDLLESIERSRPDDLLLADSESEMEFSREHRDTVKYSGQEKEELAKKYSRHLVKKTLEVYNNKKGSIKNVKSFLENELYEDFKSLAYRLGSPTALTGQKESVNYAWHDIKKHIEADNPESFNKDIKKQQLIDKQKEDSFSPTHETDTGDLVVKHPEDEGVWIDRAGEEWEFDNHNQPVALPDSSKMETTESNTPVDAKVATTESPTISKLEIDQIANESAESPLNNLPIPTEAQKEAGNYKVGKIKNLHGLAISIENPKGSTRSGRDSKGNKWSNKIKSHYGYIKGTIGADKDHLDVFVGDDAGDSSKMVYVIDQINPDSNTFDEHKIMLGYKDEAHAKKSYLENYDKNWQGIGALNALDMDAFKTWVKSGKTKKPLSWKAEKKTLEKPKLPSHYDNKEFISIIADNIKPNKQLIYQLQINTKDNALLGDLNSLVADEVFRYFKDNNKVVSTYDNKAHQQVLSDVYDVLHSRIVESQQTKRNADVPTSPRNLEQKLTVDKRVDLPPIKQDKLSSYNDENSEVDISGILPENDNKKPKEIKKKAQQQGESRSPVKASASQDLEQAVEGNTKVPELDKIDTKGDKAAQNLVKILKECGG